MPERTAPDTDGESAYRRHLLLGLERIRAGVDQLLEEWTDPGLVPKLNYMTGGYSFVSRYEPDSWADFQWVGFLAGRMWLLALLTGEDRYGQKGLQLIERMVEPLAARPPKFSAAGTDIYYGLCLGYEVTGEEWVRQAALRAIDQFALLFHEGPEVFYQVSHADRVVIDTGLNLLGLYWANRHGRTHARLAERHVRSILRLGLVRHDGSTYQAVDVDRRTGQAGQPYTLQGYADESTWSRGQAWAMHLFTSAYEATGAPDLLEVAVKTADWYVEHIPEDRVPFYDFDDPGRPRVPRDSCAAAIAVACLQRLERLVDSLRAARYRQTIEATLQTLVMDYLSPGGVLLHGSWGRLRGEKAQLRIGRFPLEDIMPYGNYWISEDLFRELSQDWRVLDLQARSVGGPRSVGGLAAT